MMAAKTVKTRSPLWAEMISRMESMFVRYQTDQGWAPVLISFASETPPRELRTGPPSVRESRLPRPRNTVPRGGPARPGKEGGVTIFDNAL